jgi:aspartyl-tRNA synthetase
MRTEYCGLTDTRYLGKTISVCGWAHRRRDHGGVIFIDLRDREGLVQVVCDPDRAATFAAADRVRNEFVLRVKGLVRRRPEGTVNPNLRSGEIEVLAHELEILNPSATPPFMIDEEHLSEEVRLKHRYLDLRREPMQKALRLRHQVVRSVRHYLDENGFIDVRRRCSTSRRPGAVPVPSRIRRPVLRPAIAAFQAAADGRGFDRYYRS